VTVSADDERFLDEVERMLERPPKPLTVAAKPKDEHVWLTASIRRRRRLEAFRRLRDRAA
jgi:hypothetical protein